MTGPIEIIAISTGGAIGATLRFLFGRIECFANIKPHLPWATLGINLIGCFLIGLVSSLLQRIDAHSALRIFLIPGILGGFTTYSAFAHESYELLRQDNLYSSISYIALTIFLGLAAVAIGSFIAERLFSAY